MAANHTVRPRRNESGERLIRRFTRKIKKLGLIEEIKDRRHHKKRSDVKRRSKATCYCPKKKERAKKRRKTTN